MEHKRRDDEIMPRTNATPDSPGARLLLSIAKHADNLREHPETAPVLAESRTAGLLALDRDLAADSAAHLAST